MILRLGVYVPFFMKKLLSAVCLFLIGSMTVSVFSPGIHKSIFHGGNECAHGHSKFPCSGHGDNSSEEEGLESCAVILFGKTSDAALSINFLSRPNLLVEEIFLSGNISTKTPDNTLNRWARGPPSTV
jgi:hypothetical protein